MKGKWKHIKHKENDDQQARYRQQPNKKQDDEHQQ